MNHYQSRASHLATVVACLVVTACASPDPSSSSTGGISLVVTSAASPLRFGAMWPPAGTSFFRLDLTLSNDASASAVPENIEMFSLTTDQEIVLMPFATSELDPCDASQSLAEGGRVSCGILFKLQTGQQPMLLSYNDSTGQTATTPVPAIAALSACEAGEALTGEASDPCMQCIKQMCSDEVSAEYTACAGGPTCSQCGTQDQQVWCACRASCMPSACKAADDARLECFLTKCSSSCT
ncbi:MAG TPA: hypothetical protein VFQ65_26295 [Kofleriaceae bacterium]|nr:hypothetical protein [Kofleriaceae bacterium]